MLAGFFLIGILGAPWAAVVVSTAALLVMTRLLNRTLPPSDVRAAAGHWTNQVAPLVVLAGLAVALRLPGPWRRALLWFVVVLGPVTLVAVPVLGRFGARPDNPTLLDRPYLLGYAVVALLSAAIALVGLRRTREDPT